MQRKPTKNTRGPNAREKRFLDFTKDSSCIICDKPGSSIVHHCMGATYKHNKVLIGHAFVIPLCYEHDSVITLGSRRGFTDKFGLQSDLWHKHYSKSTISFSDEVVDAILDSRC